MCARATFDLLVGSAEKPTPDLLGLWSASADSGGPLEELESCAWRVDLPRTPRSAGQHLAAAGQQLIGSLRRLPAVRDELAGLTGTEPSPAFGVDTGEARRTLSVWLDGALSYGNISGSPGLPQHTVDNCRALVHRVRVACLPIAEVETQVGDSLVGWSRLALGGGVTTTVRSSRTVAEMRLHQQAVELAVSSRLALLRIVGLAARAAAAVSVRLVLPGGPLLALGPVLKFVHDAMARRQ
jgi:hypothetical protein